MQASKRIKKKVHTGKDRKKNGKERATEGGGGSREVPFKSQIIIRVSVCATYNGMAKIIGQFGAYFLTAIWRTHTAIAREKEKQRSGKIRKLIARHGSTLHGKEFNWKIGRKRERMNERTQTYA